MIQFIWSLKTVQQLLRVVKRWKRGSYSLGRCIKGPSSVMEMFSVFIWVVVTWVEITCVVVIAFVEIYQTVHLRTDRHFYINCTSAKNKECQANQENKKSFETASPYFPNWIQFQDLFLIVKVLHHLDLPDQLSPVSLCNTHLMENHHDLAHTLPPLCTSLLLSFL